jgi:hypothetical protein
LTNVIGIVLDSYINEKATRKEIKMAERATFVDYIWKGETVPGDKDCLVVIVNDEKRYNQMTDEDGFDPMVWFTFKDEAEFKRAFDKNNQEFDFTLVNERKQEGN